MAYLELPFSTKVLNPLPLDGKYFNSSGLPYVNTTEVTTEIPIGIRHQGLTVFVVDTEYWFKDGVDDVDLVVKSSGSGSYTFTNGLSESGGTVKLGGTATENTTLELTNAYSFIVRNGGGGTGQLSVSGNPSSGFVSAVSNFTGGSATMQVDYAGERSFIDLTVGANSKRITLSTNNDGVYIQDAITNLGLQYAADYSTAGLTLGNRWIPDLGTIRSGFIRTDGATNTLTGAPLIYSASQTDMEFENVRIVAEPNASNAGLNVGGIYTGTVPSLNDGDFMYTGNVVGFGYYGRWNGTNREFANTSGTQTFTNKTLGSGTNWSVAPTITDGVRITFNPNATNAGINVGSHTSDPSAPSNGDIYYDSTNNLLRARINSSWVSLGAGGGGIGGSTGSVDNAILRSDGTGGSTLQSSIATLSDTGDLTITGSASTLDLVFAPSSGNNLSIVLSSTAHSIIGGNGDSYFAFLGQSSTSNGVRGTDLAFRSGAATTGNADSGHLAFEINNPIGTGLYGNFGFGTSIIGSVNYQGMQRGIFIENSVAAPSTGIINGMALFAEDVNSSSELFVMTESGAKINISGLLPPVIESGTSITLNETHRNKTIVCTNSGSITVTLNTGKADGWNCVLLVTNATGTITLAGTATVNGATSTSNQYETLALLNYGSDTYISKLG